MSRIALLRGVNVGGKNRLAMKDLVATFERLGCTDVRTYIQSGNVVFEAGAAVAKTLAAKAEAALSKGFGVSTPVVLRDAKALRATLEGCPWNDVPDERLSVMFLASTPKAADVAALDPERSPGDRFAAVGDVVYLDTPNGLAKTKLSATWLDAKLHTTATCRSWRTVRTLAELAGA